MTIGRVTLIIFFAGIGTGSLVLAKESDIASSYEMTGAMDLASNIVEKGLTQTHMDPGLVARFGLNLGPQVEFGLLGTNRKYENSEANFLLQPQLGIGLDFSARAKGALSAHQNFYFSPDGRDGTDVKLLLEILSYRIFLESIGNWEGTGTPATYLAFGKTFELAQDLVSINRVGYVSLTSEDFSSYFEASSEARYSFTDRFYSALELTGTSAPAQFGGAGEFFISLRLGTSF